MILDLEKFLTTERPHWESLERRLTNLESGGTLDLPGVEQFVADYERAAAALTKLATFAAEPTTRRHLESLVARAYAELHESQPRRPHRPWYRVLQQAMMVSFPQCFRRRIRAFQLALVITALGAVFGALSLVLDPGSRAVTMAFGHDQQTPSQRVASEEAAQGRRAGGAGTSFAAFLMQNNLKVSILALGLGMTFGLGTVIVLFHNGVILGAVAADYVTDGQSAFLAGWILPHGSIELPAILIAGQAGLVLGHALLGRGSRESLGDRLRGITGDLVTLLGGVAVMLVWAGLVEGTLSQYHEPVLPYAAKITFGLVELAALIAYLNLAGRRPESSLSNTRGIPLLEPTP